MSSPSAEDRYKNSKIVDTWCRQMVECWNRKNVEDVDYFADMVGTFGLVNFISANRGIFSRTLLSYLFNINKKLRKELILRNRDSEELVQEYIGICPEFCADEAQDVLNTIIPDDFCDCDRTVVNCMIRAGASGKQAVRNFLRTCLLNDVPIRNHLIRCVSEIRSEFWTETYTEPFGKHEIEEFLYTYVSKEPLENIAEFVNEYRV